MASIHERLRSGIEAARAGQPELAREHLAAVLEWDSQNITALLWLAFVAPTPQESLHLLHQVLALDPDNERAQAGIRWARGRLGLKPDEPEPDSPASASPGAFLRQQFLADQATEQAKKGPLAQRARRTINPLVAIIILTGALGLTAIGFQALVFIPPDTLAAWLPESARPLVVPSAAEAGSGQAPVSENRAMAEYGSAPPEAEPPLPAGDLTVSEEPALAGSINPFLLIGPAHAGAQAHTPQVFEQIPLVHEPAYPSEKWIEVNVTTQQVTAWEGDVPVMSFVVSTGLPETPTVLGEYHIYWKLRSTLMVGPNYYLPQVPYTMYFHGNYALHGTYWHSNFGQPMSHGCVNLTTDDAKTLFAWADPVLPRGQNQVVADPENPGTLVVVHE